MKTSELRRLNKAVIGITGVLIGMLVILGIRFVSYEPPKEVHYHANFAVYNDGKQEQFSNPLLYEEISECSISTEKKPGERAHLHENIKDVVHVEDSAVTWGNFFQNINWNVSDKYLDTSEDLLVNTETKKVTYVLNGEEVSNITNKVIGDKDRLLVSYGTATKDEINKQFSTVASSAEKYNATKDPASCSGGHSEDGIKDRLNHLF
ncbi:MAG: hypothetical protein WAW62_03350 [Candidatus Saccharimonas aalborgensis]